MAANSKLSLGTIVMRDPRVFDAVAGRDVVMVSLENGSYYGVSDVSRAIWEALKRPTPVADVIASLATAYDIDLASCEKQTLTFLESLQREGLLRVSNEPAA
jgi:hypothetical protein